MSASFGFVVTTEAAQRAANSSRDSDNRIASGFTAHTPAAARKASISPCISRGRVTVSSDPGAGPVLARARNVPLTTPVPQT